MLLKEDLENYNYDWSIQLNKFLLKFFGLWPDPHSTSWDGIQSTIRLTIIVTYITVVIVIPQILAIAVTWGDLMIFMDIVLVEFLMALAILKLLFMFFKKNGERVF